MTTSTDKPSRRAALAALTAVPALALPAVAPATSITTESLLAQGPDAELYALIASAREANARFDEAGEALEAATQRTEKLPPPQALIVTEADTRIWRKLRAGEPFDEAHLELMRQRLEHRQNAKLVPLSSILADAPYLATLNEKDRAVVDTLIAGEVREAELVATAIPASIEWKAARRLARARSGQTAAEERHEQLYDEKCDACERVATTRAHTLSGMLAKLAFIASDFEADELTRTTADMGTSDKILVSVAVDYKLGVEGV
jgi:hypothetical protein